MHNGSKHSYATAKRLFELKVYTIKKWKKKRKKYSGQKGVL